MAKSAAHVEVVAALVQRMRALEHGSGQSGQRRSIGVGLLDELWFPQGLLAGSLIEWIADGLGTGAWSLALAGRYRREPSPSFHERENTGKASGTPLLSPLLKRTDSAQVRSPSRWLDEKDSRAPFAAGAAPAECLGVTVVIDPEGEFYPLGLRMNRCTQGPFLSSRNSTSRGDGKRRRARGEKEPPLLIVRPRDSVGTLWSWEQALRCRGVSLVVGPIPRASPKSLRRLQLAAQRGQSLGMLIRPPAAIGEPSWAEARIQLEPLSSHGDRAGESPHLRGDIPTDSIRLMRLTLLYLRGGPGRQSIEALWDEEADCLSLAGGLGHSTSSAARRA